VAKFNKFQRPVDFEPKLSHVKRVMEGIQEQIHVFDVSGENSTEIQKQLDQCVVGWIFLFLN